MIVDPASRASVIGYAALLLAACDSDEEITRVMRHLEPQTPALTVPEVIAQVQDAVRAVRSVHGVPPAAFARLVGPHPPDLAVVPRLTLDEFVVHWPEGGDVTPFLQHEPCGELICEVEDDDGLGVLASTALAHRCPENPHPNPKET